MQQGFDISKLYSEAHSRWLKPTEVLFILQNHEKCEITPEPPNRPPSGSLFLFNRRVLRFFRNDGHAWRRKRDGRTVGEAHERLKVGNVDALNCYYAHGEQNPYFQRRSYWMLDPAYEHIVLVHYREVAEGRYVAGPMPSMSGNSSLTCIQRSSPGNSKNQGNSDFSSHSSISAEEVSSESVVGKNNSDLYAHAGPGKCGGSSRPQVKQALKMLELQLSLDDDDSPIPVEEKLPPYLTQDNSQPLNHIDYGRGNSTLDEYGNMPHRLEYIESRYHFDRHMGARDNSDSSVLLQNPGNNHKQQFQPSSTAYIAERKSSIFWEEMLELSSPISDQVGVDTEEETVKTFQSEGVLDLSAGRTDTIKQDFPAKDMKIYKKDVHQSSSEMRNLSVSSCGSSEKLISQKVDYRENNGDSTYQDPECNLLLHLSAARQFLLGSDNPVESPKSAGQFQEVEDAVPYKAGTSICDGNSMVLNDTVDWINNMHPAVDNAMYFPNHSEILLTQSQFVTPVGADSSLTVAQRQLFRIREISPEWAFSSENTKVIITGDFCCDHWQHDWKVMFGDIEVPAEIIQDGVLRCWAPQHVAGRVTLCVASGNKESCSEVREFEYRVKPETFSSEYNVQKASPAMSIEELLLLVRFGQILLSGSDAACVQREENDAPQTDPSRKPKATNDQWGQIIESVLAGCDNTLDTIDWLLQELLKDKFNQWLASKRQEYGATVYSLSKQDQSIIHIISGLGYEWALCPILNAGVGVNFRDLHGWTALHWAARFGREKMVAALLAAGASAGAVTDPTTEDFVGKTPASIAASSGHRGLAGYLSEVSLTSHLSSLRMEEFEISKGSAELVAGRAVESISERSIQIHDGATEDQLSLKDSLAAVRNAAQAAAHIQSAFRAHSFRKKKQQAAGSHDEYYLTPQEIHGLSAASKLLHGHRDQKFDKAALCIQRKYRGWRSRKNFLTLRQHVVNIQAHVRGHQVRKKYREFLWTVGVVEKVILRWRRRGAGLRGFKVESEPIDEIEADDILKVFRKQKVDAALDEAVSRVLSMVESPEARQQYRRMLESYQLAKAELESAGEATSSARGDHESRETNEDMFYFTLDETWNQLDSATMG